MVGLYGTASYDGVGALLYSISDAKVELTRFIAAGGTGKQIIPFNEDVDISAQSFGKGGCGFDGRSTLQVAASGKFAEVHCGCCCCCRSFSFSLDPASISIFPDSDCVAV